MKKVLILFGGNSFEHYISCKSAKSIIENIDKKLFKYEVCGIDFDGKWYKFSDDLDYLSNGNWKDANTVLIDNVINYLKSFDVVFPVTHGNNGEDGKLQGFFDLFNIKYVGCKTEASVIGFDKALSKNVFSYLNIPQVPYVVVNKYESDILNNLSFPMIVKPSSGGSSIGISKVNNKKELIHAIKLAKKYCNNVIVEQFIKARELECAILGNDDIICSKLGEIKSCNEFYDYDAKYVQKSEVFIPDDIPEYVAEAIRDYASKVFFSLNCSDYSRIDFFYDEENEKVYINEINTLPGFTDISMFPILMENENISYTDLISILINNC